MVHTYQNLLKVRKPSIRHVKKGIIQSPYQFITYRDHGGHYAITDHWQLVPVKYWKDCWNLFEIRIGIGSNSVLMVVYA